MFEEDLHYLTDISFVYTPYPLIYQELIKIDGIDAL